MPPGLTALELETDRALLQQIYDQYEPRMYRVALQVLKSSALAEDAVHDAFLKLIKHFSEIRKISCKELEPFVVIIVKRTALDLLKQEKRLTSLEDGWDPPAGSGLPPPGGADPLHAGHLPGGAGAALRVGVVQQGHRPAALPVGKCRGGASDAGQSLAAKQTGTGGVRP